MKSSIGEDGKVGKGSDKGGFGIRERKYEIVSQSLGRIPQITKHKNGAGSSFERGRCLDLLRCSKKPGCR